MGEAAGGQLTDMEINANLVLQLQDALDDIDELKKKMTEFGGVSQDVQSEFIEQQLRMNEHHEVFGDQVSLRIKDLKRMGQQFTVLAVAGTAILDAANNIAQLQESTEYLRVSAALSADEFKRLQEGIIQTSTITGQAIGEIAEKARTIYDLTGLIKGLDEVIIAGSHMERVFGAAGGEFERFVANTIKLSDGMTDANKLMSKFDKVVGLTGSRMSDLLTHLGQVSKMLGSITGGGAKFAHAMEQITEFTAQAAAELQRMGGEAAWIQELETSILDPNQWDQVISKMPGMAGNLYEMQQALTVGNVERFTELLNEGASQTLDMARGMDTMAIAAAGFDIRQAELFSKLDFTNLGKAADGGDAVASVLERSGALMMSLRSAWDRLWKNVSAVVARIFLPAFEEITAGFALLNDALSRNQKGFSEFGAVLAWVIELGGEIIYWGLAFLAWTTDAIGSTTTVVLGLVGMAIALKVLIVWMSKAGVGLGKFFGGALEEASKGAAKATETLAGGVANATRKLAKVAPQMALVALSLALLGGALLLTAYAFKILGESNILVAVAGLIILVAMMALLAYFAPATVVAATVLLYFAGAIAALGLALLLVSGALFVLSQVGSLAHLEGAGEIVRNLAWNLAIAGFSLALAAVTFAGPAMIVGGALFLFALAIGAFYEIMAKAGSVNLANIFKKVSTDVEDAAETAVALAKHTKALANIPELEGPAKQLAAFVDLLVKVGDNIGAITTLGKTFGALTERELEEFKGGLENIFGKGGFLFAAADSLSGAWYSYFDTAISEPVEQLTNFIDLIEKIGSSVGLVTTFGETFDKAKTDETTKGLNAIFGEGGFLFEAADTLSSSWYAYSDTDIAEPVEQLSNFIDLLEKIGDNVGLLSALGTTFGGAKSGAFQENFIKGMYGLFGPNGIMTFASQLIQDNDPGKINTKGMLENTNALVDSTLKLMTLGDMLMGGGYNQFAAIPKAYKSLHDGLKSANVDATIQMAGGAAKALGQFEVTQREHERKVEDLLGEIRDLLKGNQQVEVTKGGASSSGSNQGFANIFGSSEGSSW